jgi:hypothetical protein
MAGACATVWAVGNSPTVAATAPTVPAPANSVRRDSLEGNEDMSSLLM